MSTPITIPGTPTPPAPPKPRRRRWLRVILVILALVILAPLLLYVYVLYSTGNAWAEAEAEAAADDPNWRLMDIEANRKKIPDAENSALHVIATKGMAGGFNVSGAPNYDRIFAKLPATAQLNSQQTQLIRGALVKNQKALAEARKLKDMPYGRFSLTFTDDWISTAPNNQAVRTLADWLANDAMLRAQDGETDEAIESCQAILNAGRAIGDEPTLISFLIRAALVNISTSTLERVLAQGEPTEQALATMQAALQLEMEENTWVHGVYGERAGAHHLFENMRTGKVDGKILRTAGLGPFPTARPGNIVSAAIIEVFPRTLVHSYPGHLKYMNQAVAAAKLPIHERAAALKKLEATIMDRNNPVIFMLGPALGKVEMADSRTQIHLRTALVGLACERYRQQHKDGEWPAKLDDLVTAKLLDKLPTDPLDNQPLRYRRHKDFIAIYSIGFDLQDDGGNIDREHVRDPGFDIGFRLWNVERRRQAPLPPVVIQDGK